MLRSRIARYRRIALAAASVTALIMLGRAAPAPAATPAQGTLSPDANGQGIISWSGTVTRGDTTAGSTDDCFDAATKLPRDPTVSGCDFFKLDVSVPAGFWNTFSGGVAVDLTDFDAADIDLGIYVRNPDGTRGDRVGGSGEIAGVPEHALVPEAQGAYYVVAVPFAVLLAQSYQGGASFKTSVGGTSGVVYDTGTLTFGPATIVSAHFLGSEPQTTIERRVPGALPTAGIDPRRVFVDWPLSSRSQIGQLNRSLDGADSFRLIIDPACASRSRPMCFTGGGGDTEDEVNLFDGSVYFADQEVLVNEALASSVDHGDTFPLGRQTAASNTATGVDRQWVTSAGVGNINVGGADIRALLAYHVPAVGQYIQGVTADGIAVPQPVAQVPSVGQSGQIRMDLTDGSGHGWIYQPYNGFLPGPSGFVVATAYGPDFQSPTSWQSTQVSESSANSFPWLALDNHGNAYAVWDDDQGNVFYSFSAIDDVANNPQAGGRPGTKWSPRFEVTPPNITSAVFAEVIAGDPGRIAIAYDGYIDHTGLSDNADATDAAHTYAAVVTNALQQGGPAVVTTGQVSHRIIHTGNICTSGTACAATIPERDRSLLDMIDLNYDEDGRVGVVFTDNNSSFATPDDPESPRRSTFVHFAKQISGPSVLAAKSLLKVRPPSNPVSDPAGDATWPNRAGAPNLPTFDVLGAAIGLVGSDVVARIPLASVAVGQATDDLGRYNASGTSVPAAERQQYVLRFSTGTSVDPSTAVAGDIYHLSLERLADGTLRAFGGRLDDNDQLVNPASPMTVLGAGYHTDKGIPVQYSFNKSTLLLRTPAAFFGLAKGTRLYSVTSFAMAGPAEANELTILSVMRTVDASPPFDVVLGKFPPAQ